MIIQNISKRPKPVIHVLLSIGVLMVLACTATPATPAPTPPGPMLTEA